MYVNPVKELFFNGFCSVFGMRGSFGCASCRCWPASIACELCDVVDLEMGDDINERCHFSGVSVGVWFSMFISLKGSITRNLSCQGAGDDNSSFGVLDGSS